MNEEKSYFDPAAIVEEIRAEVEKNGPYEEILTINDIPMPEDENIFDAQTLLRGIQERNDVFEIPSAFPETSGNPVKKAYKKAMTKAVACATFPLAQRATEINFGVKVSLHDIARLLVEQQKRIEELEAKVEVLEYMISGS